MRTSSMRTRTTKTGSTRRSTSGSRKPTSRRRPPGKHVRFFRWASDRVDENGIVAFVSNSSFVHKPSLDGMRKTLATEYSDIWIVDLKGDARTAGERRRRE